MRTPPSDLRGTGLDRLRPRARTVDRALNHALNRTRDRIGELDRTQILARRLLRDIHANDITARNAMDRVRELDRALDRVRNLDIRGRDRKADAILASGGVGLGLDDLAFFLIRVPVRVTDLDSDGFREFIGALDCALDRGHEVVAVLEQARREIGELAATVKSVAIAKGRSRPAAMARWTTRCAARILPASQRARYAEEYAGELAELAYQGATCRQQLDYGLQVLFNAFSLHWSLRRPATKTAREE